MTASRAPDLKLEKALLAEGNLLVAGSDEVGRGALSGPVTAGVVVVDASTRRQPSGLRDSKLLSPAEREALVPRIERWAVAFGVGHASAAEIDRFGILAALRLAGERALGRLAEPPRLVLLDGNYDWYTRPPRPLQAFPDGPAAAGCGADPRARRALPERVVLRVKGDLACASVAAASVIAKVARDRLMTELAASYPEYGWDENKGYATPHHSSMLRELGPTEEHRRSWRLSCFRPEQLELDLALDGLDCDADAQLQANEGLNGLSEAPVPARR
jgi:ribonuclease HII